MNAGKRAWPFALVAVALVVVVAVMLRAGVAQHGSFKAFYCGAYAVRAGADPYLVEPLRTCEHIVARQALPAQAVEPAPLPGYDFAFLLPLTLLPFGKAAAAFAYFSLAAALAAALLLARLTKIPAYAIAAISAPLVLLNIAFGEIPVLTMAALSAAGYAVHHRRYGWAAVAVAAAMLQPQIGVAAALSLFLLAPRARFALAVSLAALGVICLASIGPAAMLAYVQHVLPAQAASEVTAADQYSLAHQLFLLGAAPATALRVAGITGVVVLVAGIWAAAVASRRRQAPEMIVFLPAAAVLLGGVYAHDILVIVALPAALATVARIAQPQRAFGLLALLALALVWTEFPGRALLVVDVVAIVAACGVCLSGTIAAVAGSAALCTAAFALFIVLVHGGPRSVPVTRQMASIASTSLASDAWRAYLNATPARTVNNLQRTGQKVPAWLGVVLLVGLCVRRA